MEHEMNYANIVLLWNVLTFVLPLAIGFVASMLGSYLVFTLPTWLKRRASRRAALRAPAPESSLAIVPALPAADLDRGASGTDPHEELEDRWTA